MIIRRRSVLGGLAGLGLGAALPAWAQAIGPQSDPWAQVDPYADPRNGFSSERRAEPPVPGPRGSAERLTLSAADQDEISVGRSVYPRWIKEGGGAYPDARAQQALRDFCRPLFAVADRAALPWTVTLTNERAPNAAAGAGGMVIVHAGMVALCDTPYALAAVLAHEVGHVDCRHSTRGLDMGQLAEIARAQGMTAMGDKAMAQTMPDVAGRVPDFMKLMDLTFSREDEAEADAHAVEIFDRLGIDPALASSGMRALLDFERKHGGGAPNEWVTDHPLTPDRVRAMDALAATRSKPRSNFTFPTWGVLKANFPSL